ncbi:hypothetical protein [Pelagicoccus sp. SDUM812002]|uniref:hypothetical protein n=1 Tax=Pelagicoccus sp. SDUM812002 TaxID=3041266 RepID=UPI002810692C|nr:hypothetical protein [Pelagicoccus sp. SDUM812002]MDQ8185866.1 hypothetical protein [Pelagicoccus sp. SDUM812002]
MGLLAFLTLPVSWSQETDDDALRAASEAALARVAQDVEKRGVNERVLIPGTKLRRRSRMGAIDPIYRHGVAYFDEWTIRAGALKLRVPAYHGWEGVKPTSDFYRSQAQMGRPGELLVLPITNQEFVRSTRSKYVNNYGLIWVPQEHAFVSMTEDGFAPFKEEVKERIVEERRRRLNRDDFWEYDDYIAFKRGNDEHVDEFQNGYWFRAIDEPTVVTYFAVSEFVFQTNREEIRQPMVQTMTYALVRGKLLRFDFKKLHLSDEDAAQLISFTRQFVADMRAVNGLSERKIR